MTILSFLETIISGLADACCIFLVFAACLQLAWHQSARRPVGADAAGQAEAETAGKTVRQTDRHSPCWWKEVCLPLGAAYLFAWNWHGAGEGLVLWLSLLAPCVLAAALFTLLDLANSRHVQAVQNLSLVLFVPAVALLVFV